MSEVKYDGKYIQVLQEKNWEYVSRKSVKEAVIIAPLKKDADGRYYLILISEYRVPLGKRELGFPAGLVGDQAGKEKEDIFAAARREMVEETGFLPKSLKLLVENTPSSSGLTDETFHLFLAEDLIKVEDGGGDESEDINVVEVPLDNIKLMIEQYAEDHLISPKIYMALYFLKEFNYEIL